MTYDDQLSRLRAMLASGRLSVRDFVFAVDALRAEFGLPREVRA